LQIIDSQDKLNIKFIILMLHIEHNQLDFYLDMQESNFNKLNLHNNNLQKERLRIVLILIDSSFRVKWKTFLTIKSNLNETWNKIQLLKKIRSIINDINCITFRISRRYYLGILSISVSAYNVIKKRVI